MPLPHIDPPLVNSANPWATTLEDLQALFDSPHTGAITTRTTMLAGFEHDSKIHQYTFFEPDGHSSKPANTPSGNISSSFSGSLNTLGYSPISFNTYLNMPGKIMANSRLPHNASQRKPFIISVTGSADEVAECYRRVQGLQAIMPNPLCMEINLSCPNIPGKAPPAYSASSLAEYLKALGKQTTLLDTQRVYIGIKTPPYTYHDQFQVLIDALLAASKPNCPIDFITATNTLGSSLVLSNTDGTPALGSASGLGIGGMAGASLHPLALGNVKTIRSMLDKHDQLKSIDIIGVGGVSDRAGFNRMRAVGATVVGVGTALGMEGVNIFDKIVNATE